MMDINDPNKEEEMTTTTPIRPTGSRTVTFSMSVRGLVAALMVISAVVIAVSVAAFIYAQPPSDPYGYSSSTCSVMLDSRDSLQRKITYFRDPRVVDAAKRQLENLNAWADEKGC